MLSTLLTAEYRHYQKYSWDDLVQIDDPSIEARAKINAPTDNRIVFTWIWENMPDSDTLLFDVSPFKWYTADSTNAIEFNAARVLYLMYEYTDACHAIKQSTLTEAITISS